MEPLIKGKLSFYQRFQCIGHYLERLEVLRADVQALHEADQVGVAWGSPAHFLPDVSGEGGPGGFGHARDAALGLDPAPSRTAVLLRRRLAAHGQRQPVVVRGGGGAGETPSSSSSSRGGPAWGRPGVTHGETTPPHLAPKAAVLAEAKILTVDVSTWGLVSEGSSPHGPLLGPAPPRLLGVVLVVVLGGVADPLTLVGAGSGGGVQWRASPGKTRDGPTLVVGGRGSISGPSWLSVSHSHVSSHLLRVGHTPSPLHHVSLLRRCLGGAGGHHTRERGVVVVVVVRGERWKSKGRHGGDDLRHMVHPRATVSRVNGRDPDIGGVHLDVALKGEVWQTRRRKWGGAIRGPHRERRRHIPR